MTRSRSHSAILISTQGTGQGLGDRSPGDQRVHYQPEYKLPVAVDSQTTETSTGKAESDQQLRLQQMQHIRLSMAYSEVDGQPLPVECELSPEQWNWN